jgi:predicted aconitase with swiveling domain
VHLPGSHPIAGCTGPAVFILGTPDQILTLGAVVAREMGYAGIPVVQIDADKFDFLPGRIKIDKEGWVSTARVRS